jgi:hypothetical protein
MNEFLDRAFAVAPVVLGLAVGWYSVRHDFHVHGTKTLSRLGKLILAAMLVLALLSGLTAWHSIDERSAKDLATAEQQTTLRKLEETQSQLKASQDAMAVTMTAEWKAVNDEFVGRIVAAQAGINAYVEELMNGEKQQIAKLTPENKKLLETYFAAVALAIVKKNAATEEERADALRKVATLEADAVKTALAPSIVTAAAVPASLTALGTKVDAIAGVPASLTSLGSKVDALGCAKSCVDDKALDVMLQKALKGCAAAGSPPVPVVQPNQIAPAIAAPSIGADAGTH